MAQNDIVHIVPICEELQRLCDTMLKTSLNLQSVNVGDVFLLPPDDITTLVNGIWIHPFPETRNEPIEIPKPLLQTYNFRFVYIRRMLVGENPVKKGMIDTALIINSISDKFNLPDITNLPGHAQVLWVLWKSTEWEPQEDDYVSRLGADLKAVAINWEVKVRTRRNFG